MSPAIFLAAFLIRLVYIIQIKATVLHSHFILDEAFYNNWARNIAGGDWFGKGVFDALPLYPYLLGIIYRIFGPNPFTARLIMIIIDSASCVLIYILTKKIFNKRTGLIAAAVAVLYGPFIFYSGLFVPETVVIFIYLLSILLLFKAKESQALCVRGPKTSLNFFLCGAVMGLALLSRAGIALFLPAAFIWIIASSATKRKGLLAALFMVCGIMLVILPIAIRNYLVCGEKMILTSHAGFNFYIGNNGAADGTFKPPSWARSNIEGLRADIKTLAELEVRRPLTETETSRFYFDKALSFIRQHPFRFLKLFGHKLFLFINSQEIYDVASYDVYKELIPILKFPFLTFLIIGPIGLAGLIIAIVRVRIRNLAPLYLFTATYAVSVTLYFVNSRYRLPFAMAMIIFSAIFINQLIDRMANRKYIAAFIMLTLSIPLFALAGLATGVETRPTGYNNLGNIYMDAGEWDKAIEVFKKAIAIDSSDPKPYNDIGFIYLGQNRLGDAEEYLLKSLNKDHEYPFAHINLGILYERKGDTDAAEKEYRRAIRLNPNIAEAHNNMANMYVGRQDYNLAIEEYRAALSLNPSNPKTHYNLGVVYGRLGKYKEAEEEFRESYRLDPAFEPAKEALSYFR